MTAPAEIEERSIGLTPKNIRALGAAIILQAMEDWVLLINYEERIKTRGKSEARKTYAYRVGQTNYVEILKFLEGGMGAELCYQLDIDPKAVIERLLKMRADYYSYGTLPKLSGLEGGGFRR